jgi:hypothetical protein
VVACVGPAAACEHEVPPIDLRWSGDVGSLVVDPPSLRVSVGPGGTVAPAAVSIRSPDGHAFTVVSISDPQELLRTHVKAESPGSTRLDVELLGRAPDDFASGSLQVTTSDAVMPSFKIPYVIFHGDSAASGSAAVSTPP